VTNIITKNNINNFIITNPTAITKLDGATGVSIHPSNIVPTGQQSSFGQKQMQQPLQVLVK
jgi:hypothetical protein